MLSDWDTSSAPLWALRRASFLIEAGDRQLAEEILIRALEDLRSVADEGTPETWSIESWIIYNLRFLNTVRKLEGRQASQTQLSQVGASSDPKLPPRVTRNYDDSQRYPLQDRSPEFQKPSNSTDERVPDFHGPLNWLRKHGCDSAAILEWLEEQNSREFIRALETARMPQFDSRQWVNHIASSPGAFSQRMIAAYRALRLIEDGGLPLRSGNVQLAASLAKKAIAFLAESDAIEATGAVLRLRTDEMIEKWFTRYRIAILADAEIQRLYKIGYESLCRLVKNPDALVRDTDAKRQFAAAAELLSRVAIRADDAALQKVLRFTIALAKQLQIWDKWWLADDISVLVRRVCNGLSTSAFRQMLPELLQAPVPGSPGFPPLPSHVDWTDPVALFGEREALPAPAKANDIDTQVDSLIKRIRVISNDTDFITERRYLLVRLVTLADKGLLNAAQKGGLAKAIFARRDPVTGLPIDSGCVDSVVLLVPRVDGVDERKLFRAKYVRTSWPREYQALYSLLDSLSRTGPAMKSGTGCRLRGINWSLADLWEIAERCRSTIEQQRQVVLTEHAAAKEYGSIRKVFGNAEDRAKDVVNLVAAVIDNVVLQRESIQSDTWETIVAAVSRSMQAGLPTLRVYPKLASFDGHFRTILVEEIVSRLSGGDEDRLREAMFSLNHWANQLTDSRIPGIPDLVLACVAGHLDGEYSYELIHILDTTGNLLRRLPEAQARRFLRRCEPSLGRWSKRLQYKAVGRHWEYYAGLCAEIPDLRASMTRLCVRVRNCGLLSETVTSWLESIGDDPMPEVRRALLEDGE